MTATYTKKSITISLRRSVTLDSCGFEEKDGQLDSETHYISLLLISSKFRRIGSCIINWLRWFFNNFCFRGVVIIPVFDILRFLNPVGDLWWLGLRSLRRIRNDRVPWIWKEWLIKHRDRGHANVIARIKARKRMIEFACRSIFTEAVCAEVSTHIFSLQNKNLNHHKIGKINADTD